MFCPRHCQAAPELLILMRSSSFARRALGFNSQIYSKERSESENINQSINHLFENTGSK